MQPSNVLQIRQVVDTNEFTTKVKIVEKVIEVFKHRQPWILVSACISAEGSFLYPILTFEQHLQVLIVLQVVFQFLLQNMMTSPKLKELYESNMNFSTSHQGGGSWV